MKLEQLTAAQLAAQQADLAQAMDRYRAAGLNLDLTRGKPSAEQLALADGLDGILQGNYQMDGTDLRNYGGLDGLPSAKTLFAQVLDVKPEQVLVGGNGSLTLMHQCATFAHLFGLNGDESAWASEGDIKFLCPVPGYDRHFAICEHLGISMIAVPLTATGPDMDAVEALVKADPLIKGIWCVPRFSNPTGCVYSDETVDRMAQLGHIAGPNFRIFWDNAYAVHTLQNDAAQLAPIMAACERHQTQDSVFIFGSTSKITHAGAGVGFMAASSANLQAIKAHLGLETIGPDKINQARHVHFLRDAAGIQAHMQQHAKLLNPRFDAVLQILQHELGDAGYASWTKPQGGYFISLDTRPGLASEVVAMAADVGVKLTPAGATFPYGKDPEDCNIRIAPSFPSVADISAATAVLATCIKLATLRHLAAK